MSARWIRPVTWLVAAIVGVVYGAAGTVGQAFTWGVLPVGLVVAVVGVVAVLFAVRRLTGDRWAALATGLGAMVATLVLSGAGPGGSVVVPAPAPGEISTGIVWTIVVPLAVAVVTAWPAARPARST